MSAVQACRPEFVHPAPMKRAQHDYMPLWIQYSTVEIRNSQSSLDRQLQQNDRFRVQRRKWGATEGDADGHTLATLGVHTPHIHLCTHEYLTTHTHAHIYMHTIYINHMNTYIPHSYTHIPMYHKHIYILTLHIYTIHTCLHTTHIYTPYTYIV